mgnify:CR=1 FL=1
MNNCKKCGSQVFEGEKFCRNCGEPIINNNENRVGDNVISNQINMNSNLNNQNNILNNNSQMQNYNNQNINQAPNNNQNSNASTNKNKNNNMPYIILGTIVVLLVIVVGLLLFLNKDNKSHNKNDYDEPINTGTNTGTNGTTTTTTTNANTITSNGFKFNKVSGYNYETDTDSNSLIITNDKYYIGVVVNNISLSSITSLKTLETAYQAEGVNIKNLHYTQINGKKVVVGDATIDGYSVVWYIIDSKQSGYLFQGYIANSNFVPNYNDVSVVDNLISDAQYVGNYKDYSLKLDSIKK